MKPAKFVSKLTSYSDLRTLVSQAEPKACVETEQYSLLEDINVAHLSQRRKRIL